jgi:CheY-like chemotaxis protein
MRVLVVDDNVTVRRALVRLLATQGIQAAGAENGEAALVRVQEEDFDVILCDLMMPLMDGMTFYDDLSVLRPDLTSRVIFVSAWVDEPEVKDFLGRTKRPVVPKPFEMPELVRQIRAVA